MVWLGRGRRYPAVVGAPFDGDAFGRPLASFASLDGREWACFVALGLGYAESPVMSAARLLGRCFRRG